MNLDSSGEFLFLINQIFPAVGSIKPQEPRKDEVLDCFKGREQAMCHFLIEESLQDLVRHTYSLNSFYILMCTNISKVTHHARGIARTDIHLVLLSSLNIVSALLLLFLSLLECKYIRENMCYVFPHILLSSVNIYSMTSDVRQKTIYGFHRCTSSAYSSYFLK